MQTVTVTFYTLDYAKFSLEEIEEVTNQNPTLANAARLRAEELEELGVEIFEIKNNVLFTEDGYVVALYADIQELNPEIWN